MKPLSVIMPAYNVERYIRKAMDSVLAQTFTDFEFIIVDDCSTDRTAEIILSYQDDRIRYFKHERNGGITRALNTAISHASGKYIARMDPDDICLPERFQVQVSYLDAHPEITLVDCPVITIDKDDAIITHAELKTFDNWPAFRKKFLRGSSIIHPSIMLRGDVLRAFTYTCHYYEDYALFLQLINASHQFYRIPQHLLMYRINPDSIITTDIRTANYVRKMFITKWEYLQQLKARDWTKPFNLAVAWYFSVSLVFRAIKERKSFSALLRVSKPG